MLEATELLRRSLPGGFRGAVRLDRNGVVLLDFAIGADGAGVAIRPSTAFQIASVTKTFTAAVVLTLADEGLLSLDDHLPTWIPEAPRGWSQITLRHLLTHTSGLPHWAGIPSLDMYSPCERAELISLITSAPLQNPPGTRWSYSSLGFVLLAHIAETVYQCPWASLVARRLLQPLGLHETAVAVPPWTTVAAHGSRNGEASRSFDLATVNLGTGDIWSTTGDLARWPCAISRTAILSPATRQQMLTRQAAVAASDDGFTDVGYGYGWHTARCAGIRVVFHGGDQPGFTSLLVWAPEPDVTLAVLSADEIKLAPAVLPALVQLLGETARP